MSADRIGPIPESISDVIGERIRDLRKRLGLSRDEVAAAAREAGAGEQFTATVVGFLETGRPNKTGQRTRHFALDEVFHLATALEVSPLELLGDQAVLFTSDEAKPCPTCTAEAGALERVVREDVAGLGDLATLEPSLVQTALRLARAIDESTGEQVKALPQLTRELRATLEAITAGRRRSDPEPDEDEDLGSLDEPE